MFRERKWTTPYWENPMTIIIKTLDETNGDIGDVNADFSFCLRRGMHGTPPGVNSIRKILKIPARRYHDFALHMIHNYHNKIHNMIGGTMATDYSANAPEFWLHHGFLDKIWYMWQLQSYDHKYVHFLQRNQTKMMGCKYTRRDYIDSHSLPKCTRVKYTNSAGYSRGELPRETDTSEEKDKWGSLEDSTRNEKDMHVVEPIDDMARTSYKFWQHYLKKKWDDEFPTCKSTEKDSWRAHELHLQIDL